MNAPTTAAPNRLAYVKFMRLMAWTAVACTAAYVVLVTFGRVGEWGI